MSDTAIVTFRGKTNFAKVLGPPVGNKWGDDKNWTVDLVLGPESVKEAKALGIGDRIKRKDDYLDGQPHMSFKQPELRKSGEKNDPIKVVEIDGKTPWDQNKLLGNGTDVDIKFAVADFGKGKKKGVYIRSIRVLKLVPYERKEFADIDEDDEFFEAAQAAAALDADRRQREAAQFKKDFQLEDDDLDDESPL